MSCFRKRPVVIEAWLLDFRKWNQKPLWLYDAIMAGQVWMQGGSAPYLTIQTLEGEMRAEPGDWIIQGVAGELYPCKPDIFAATYEAVA